MMADNDFIVLENASLKLTLCRPGTYYTGTRFDWNGVFRKVECDGVSYCDEWFDGGEPSVHDHVCGPSEEFFGFIGYDDAPVGGDFLKLGVGLLRREDEGPEQRFHTYRITDGGCRDLFADKEKAVFAHSLPGIYEYEKTVEICGERTFRIAHRLLNTGKDELVTRQYNHNFFTFGLNQVGVERRVEWDFPIEGKWREDSVYAEKDERCVRVTAPLQIGQTVFLQDIHPIGEGGRGYGFTLSAGERSVTVRSGSAMTSSVLWANSRVFCPEPYIELNIGSGEAASWWIEYTLG